jgi:hypothetical protein
MATPLPTAGASARLKRNTRRQRRVARQASNEAAEELAPRRPSSVPFIGQSRKIEDVRGFVAPNDQG